MSTWSYDVSYHFPVCFVPQSKPMNSYCKSSWSTLMTGCGSRSVALVYHNADWEPCCALLFTSSVILFFVIGSMSLLICCPEGWSVICTLSMYLVVLASSSTFSFPGIPMWLGIQLMCIILFVRWCCLSRCYVTTQTTQATILLYQAEG